MFNEIVSQGESKEILDIFGIYTKEYAKGYLTADLVEDIAAICRHAPPARLPSAE